MKILVIPKKIISKKSYAVPEWSLKRLRHAIGRWRLTYKKCECKLYNVRYVIMAAAVLHNTCIYRNDPRNPDGDSKL